jgi:hypothetical protein
MNKTGVVEQLGGRDVKTRFGMKKTYSAKVGGEWFNFNFKDPRLIVGEAVSIEYTPGTYGNDVTHVEKGGVVPAASAPSEAAAPAPRPSYGSKGAFPIPPLDGQRAIVRQNAITNARELLVGIVGPQLKPEETKSWADRQKQLDTLSAEVIRVARKFEEYACGDDAMAAAKASMEEPSSTKH